MKKSFILLVLIILAIIISSFAAITNEKLSYKTKLANQIFMANLNQAQSGFGMDYSKMSDDEKIYYYSKTSSSLWTAMNILDLTSYNDLENRNDLFGAVHNLYWCMTRSDSRNEILKSKTFSIYTYLMKIIQNPKNKKDCDALSKLAGDIYFHCVK